MQAITLEVIIRAVFGVNDAERVEARGKPAPSPAGNHVRATGLLHRELLGPSGA